MTTFERAEYLVASVVLAMGRSVACQAHVEGGDLVLRPIAMGNMRASKVLAKPTPLEPPAFHAVADSARDVTPADAAREAIREYRRSRWRRAVAFDPKLFASKGGAA